MKLHCQSPSASSYPGLDLPVCCQGRTVAVRVRSRPGNGITTRLAFATFGRWSEISIAPDMQYPFYLRTDVLLRCVYPYLPNIKHGIGRPETSFYLDHIPS